MKVLSDLWLQKCIMSESRLDMSDYNLGLMFKILISGDRSMFFDKKAAEIQAKHQKKVKPGQTQNLSQIMEQWTKYAPNDFTTLEGIISLPLNPY